MKKLIILLILLIPLTISAQDWRVEITAVGNLPYGTNIATFQNQVSNAVESALDSLATYTFDIRVNATQDTTIYSAEVRIMGQLDNSKVLKTFAGQVKTFFEGKFDSATLTTRFFIYKEW